MTDTAMFPDDMRFDDDSLPGWVVRTGLSVRLPADHVVIAPAVTSGMLATHQLSVPVSGTVKGGCIGALVLAPPEHGPSFNETTCARSAPSPRRPRRTAPPRRCRAVHRQVRGPRPGRQRRCRCRCAATDQ